MDNLKNIAKKAVSLVASLAMVAVMLPAGVVSAATVSNGDVIKAPTTDALYLIQDGQKRVFPYVTVYYSWGFTDDWANEVTNVDATTFNAFPTGEPLNFRDGYIFRATESAVAGYESEAVFFVSEGKIRPFHSAAAYEKMVNNGASNDWSKVTWVPDDFLMKFQFQPGNVIDESYVDAGNLPNGMLVSPESSNTVYLVSNGKLRAFVTDAALAANGYDPAMVVEVSDSRIAIKQNGVNVTGQEPALKTPGYVGTPVTPEEPTSDLTVSAVSSNGMRLVNVVFSKAVDENTAETKSNYVLRNNKSTSVSVTAAKLLDDKRTVQLYLAAGFYNDSEQDSIEIKNVKSESQLETVATKTHSLTVSDSSVPVVSSVQALGSKAIRVTFSEPVTRLTDLNSTTKGVYTSFIQLDDKSLLTGSASSTTTQIGGVTVTYPDTGDYTKALITFAAPLTVGDHTMTISYGGGISDYNVLSTATTADARTMQPANYVVTVSSDSSVPMLSSIEVLSQTKVRYNFTKALDNNSVAAGDFYYSTSSSASSGTAANSATRVSDTSYDVTWSSAISAGLKYFYVKNVADFSGNNISPNPAKQSYTVVADTAPSIVSVSMDTDSDKKVVVMFSKDVDESTSETSSNYTFKSASGTVLTSTTGGNGIGASGHPSTSPKLDVDGTNKNYKKVTIDLGTADAYALPGGSYQLCVTKVKAKSASSTSAMNEECVGFTVTDKTRPTYDSYSAGTNKLVIKYSEAMGSAALAPANYKIRGNSSTSVANSTATDTSTGWTKLSDISGVSLSFKNNNKDVEITFPDSEDLVTGVTDFMIGYTDGSSTYTPTDASGNLFKDSIGNVSQTFTNITVDSSAITTASSVKVKSATQIEVKFARNIDPDSLDVSDFTLINSVNSDLNPSSALVCTTANYDNRANTMCSSEDESLVVFTIPSGEENEFTSNDTTVTLKTKFQTINTKDELGLALTANNTFSTSAINDIAPIMKSFVLSDATHIVLTFDGKIESSATNRTDLASDLIISQTVDGTTTTQTAGNLAVTLSAGDSTNVAIALATALSLSEPVTVKTVAADSLNARGANGALIAANTTGITNSSFVASSITHLLNAPIIAGDSITISFNKNVDHSTIASSGWESVDTSNYKLVTADGVDAIFSDVDNEISFSGGANIGKFAVPIVTVGAVEATADVTEVYFNTSARTLKITFGAPSVVTSVSGTITYTPSTSIQTTENTAITTEFKPVVAAADKVAPTFTTVTMASNNANTTFATIGDVVTLTIVGSEALDTSTVVATIGTNAATVVCTTTTACTATYTLVTGDTEGSLAFTLDAEDVAGNAATQVVALTGGSAVTFDETAPTLSSAATVANVLTLTFSEATDIPTLTAASFKINSTVATTQFGTGATFVWNTAGTVLTITPGSNTTLAVGDVITFVAADTVEDLAGNDFGTGTLDTVADGEYYAPTATVTATDATTNDADSLVITYSEALYVGGVAATDGAITGFTMASGDGSISSATYSVSAKTVTFVISGATGTETITAGATITDLSGNAVANDVATYASAGTVWTLN